MEQELRGFILSLSLRHSVDEKGTCLPLCLERGQFLIYFSNRKGYISKDEYIDFLTDKESENIRSSDELEDSFQALAEGKAYITKEDMKQVRFPFVSTLTALASSSRFCSSQVWLPSYYRQLLSSPPCFFRYCHVLVICFGHYFMLFWPNSETYSQCLNISSLIPNMLLGFKTISLFCLFNKPNLKKGVNSAIRMKWESLDKNWVEKMSWFY